MRWGVLAAAITCLICNSAVSAKSAHKEFTEVWQERDDRYLVEAQKADENLKTTAAAFGAALKAQKPDMKKEITAAFDAVERKGYANGRGYILREFRIHMDKKPSLQRTDLWLQEKMDIVRTEAAKADAAEETVNGLRASETSPPDLLTAVEASRNARGVLMGKVDELILINQNVQSYYQARSAESERRAAFWGAIGRSLQQSSQANRSTFTNCTTIGIHTNCMSH